MLPVLEFLFSSFWRWAGGLVYLCVLVGAIVGLVECLRPRKCCRSEKDEGK